MYFVLILEQADTSGRYLKTPLFVFGYVLSYAFYEQGI